MKLAVQRGFTLIEVMVVVAIVAILASVALPAYTSYIRRGQLPEAFTYLSDYRIKMEQYYQDKRNYGTGSTCATDAPGTWKDFAPAGRKFFDFSCTPSSTGNQKFLITATGKNATRAKGYVYTVDQDGIKKTTKLNDTTVDLGCWATKAGDC